MFESAQVQAIVTVMVARYDRPGPARQLSRRGIPVLRVKSVACPGLTGRLDRATMMGSFKLSTPSSESRVRVTRAALDRDSEPGPGLRRERPHGRARRRRRKTRRPTRMPAAPWRGTDRCLFRADSDTFSDHVGCGIQWRHEGLGYGAPGSACLSSFRAADRGGYPAPRAAAAAGGG